ncbi:MAG: response regulator [Stenomitos rutilans HA7619-LM2]|jgi:CheY-like chemotaxis protein|nr:response regulator [Stenomitos rutilans HA7619-LM2]
MVSAFDRVLPLKILLADDHLVNQKVTLLMLKRLGYQADVVGNGLEALAVLQQQPYDVVLLDVQMPEMDGLEVARRICQQAPSHLRPYLIALTANVMSGDREMCLRAGIDHYMSKPIRMQELGQVLGQCKPLRASIAHVEGHFSPDSTGSPASVTNCHNYAALDLAVLSSFRQEMGETGNAVIAELIACYLAEAPRLLQTLHLAVSHHDVKTVQRIAHGLKASSASLGALSLSQRCSALETMSLSASIDDITIEVACLESEYACVEAALRQTQSYRAL